MTPSTAPAGGVFGGVLVGQLNVTLPKQPYPLLLTSIAIVIDMAGCSEDAAIIITWLDGETQPYSFAVSPLLEAGFVHFVSFGLGLQPSSVKYGNGGQTFVVNTAPLPRDVLVDGVEAVRFQFHGTDADQATLSSIRYRWRVDQSD